MPLILGYHELRLRISRRGAGSYHVFASTRSAEVSGNFKLPFSEREIEDFILKVGDRHGRRGVAPSAIGEARTFGGRLFKALFDGEVLSLYRNALSEARGQDRGVRITLCLSESPELIDVPWEYLFDDPDFLALSAFTPVVRYLDLPRGHRPLLVESPLRLLGIVSSPRDYQQLDVERERSNLQAAVSDLSDGGTIELHWLERPTLGGVLRALQSNMFHALHYIGHGDYDRGTQTGVLLFEDDNGWARPVGGDELGMIVHDFSSLRLAVLNACEGARTARSDPFAGVAGSLVRRDIPAVVAMQFEISDEAAVLFAGGFYRQLAAGAPVDASLAAARLAMLAERSDDIEWGTPVLFMRVPDGRIFNFGSQDELAPTAVGAPSMSSDEQPQTATSRAVPDGSTDRRSLISRNRLTPDQLQERLETQAANEAHLVYMDAHGRQIIKRLGSARPTATLGRHLPGIDISLDWDSKVSRRHASLEAIDRDWIVVDLGSRNGTLVNGEAVLGRRRLRDGDTLTLGATSIVFRSPHRTQGYTTKPAAGSRMAYQISDAEQRLLVALCRPLKASGHALPATNGAIADELAISVPAVKKQLSALFVRFELDQLPKAEKRTRLAVAALHSGLIVVRDL